MRQVVLTHPGHFDLREAPMPQLERAEDVLLRVESVGVCGSDIHYFKQGRIGSQKLEGPFVVGHECSARVEAVGTAVRGLSPGARVAIDPLVCCGKCDQCSAGRPHTCRKQQFLGCPGQLQGAMRDYLVMPEECCFEVGQELSPGATVMAEPLAIGLHAQRQFGPVQPGGAFAVLGCGPVGLCVLTALQQAGARDVACSEPLAYRQAMARQLGAPRVEHPDSAGAAWVKSYPSGFDAVFECSGEPEALRFGLETLKPGGTLVIVGIPEDDSISLDIGLLRRKELVIKNVRRQNGCAEDAARMLDAGLTGLETVVTHHFQPEESQQAFELVSRYGDGVGKALIHFSAR